MGRIKPSEEQPILNGGKKMATEIIYKNKKGETKYYATYQSAWNAAIRLNETEIRGTWLFEGDATGMWYLHLELDN
jgi:hypothetical protein